jgi:protein-S-isoprenylcysteine O-methyltransferase Ste14
MKMAGQNLISFLLPITVLIFVPWCIEKNLSIHPVSTFIIGLIIILAGLSMLIHAVSIIIKIGKGTLAPWLPARKLVVTGMYRYVRNPMIIGVLIALAGESIALMSLKIFIWAVIFFTLNHLFFIIYEEPTLKKKFGDEYHEYKRNVPRWLPRVKPYKPV